MNTPSQTWGEALIRHLGRCRRRGPPVSFQRNRRADRRSLPGGALVSNVEIKPASAAELRTVLRLTLRSAGQSEADLESLVSGFIHYARELSLDLSHQWLGLVDGRIVSACTCVESPGRTAVLFLPTGEMASTRTSRDTVAALISNAIEHESRRDISLLQCLIEPDDVPNRSRAPHRPARRVLRACRPR
jgi:hypothetical protein